MHKHGFSNKDGELLKLSSSTASGPPSPTGEGSFCKEIAPFGDSSACARRVAPGYFDYANAQHDGVNIVINKNQHFNNFILIITPTAATTTPCFGAP